MVGVPIGGSRAFIILIYGTDPDRGETCVLNVVEIFSDGIPVSATPSGMRSSSTGRGREKVPGLVLRLTGGWVCTIGEGITVSKKSGVLIRAVEL